MRTPQQDLLARWLAAERDDRSDEAETALLALFSELPAAAPPAGLADRVMARVAREAPVAQRRNVFAHRVVRAVLALALLVTGVSLIWLPPVVRAFAGLWGPGDLVRLWTASITGLVEVFASLAAFGEWLFLLGRALALLPATPGVAVVLAVCLAVSMVAFRFLRDLITRERSWVDVENI